jgi:hypothetical protein
MIVFDLECPKGHRFEGWFNESRSFEEQTAKNLVTCPVCGENRIRKVFSPVATCTLRSEPENRSEPPSPPIDYKRLARALLEHIHKDFQDVGTDFAKEALKMHYGVKEKKNIRGYATAEEETTLKEEKIEFFKVPVLKEEKGES